MTTPKTLLFVIVSGVLSIAASAALPTFSQQPINLPPLTLAEIAKNGQHSLERSAPVAPMRVIVPERPVTRPDKFVISPRMGVDYKLLIKHPDPSVDYQMIVKDVGAQVRK